MKIVRRQFAGGLGALLFAGCMLPSAVDREAPMAVVFKGTRLETTALVEALLATKGTRVQAINGAYRDEAFQANCVMKGDGEKLTVVFLTPVVRLVTIMVTKPHALHCEKAAQLPRAFEPEYALVDLAFVNLPVATLAECVGDSLHVDERDGVRKISAADGTLIAELRTAADGSQVYRNAVFGYEYTLRDMVP